MFYFAKKNPLRFSPKSSLKLISSKWLSFWLTTYLLFLEACFSTDIPKPYNCTPLCADLFIYLYEANFIQVLLKKNEKKLAQFFYFTFHYIYAVLSLNNSNFVDFVDCIYPIKLEIKDTKYTARSASYLDLHLEIDNERGLNFTTNEMISIFKLWTFHLYEATFQQLLHTENISLILSDMSMLVVPIMISLIECCC